MSQHNGKHHHTNTTPTQYHTTISQTSYGYATGVEAASTSSSKPFFFKPFFNGFRSFFNPFSNAFSNAFFIWGVVANENRLARRSRAECAARATPARVRDPLF